MKRLALSIVTLALLAAACTASSVAAEKGKPLAVSTHTSISPVPSLPSPSPLPENTSADPVVAVVQRALPAVVNVTTNLLEQSLFGSQPGRGVGTGFVVRSDGIVVTNFHVVEGAERITITTSTPPTRSFTARVIGGDEDADLAVLKVNATGLPTVSLGNSSDLQLGESVVAMGYALALTGGPSVTSGIVSSLNREVKAADPNFHGGGTRTYSHAIQTDAAINPGNSGGPLLNLDGQVVGINTAGAQQAENIGFAIAIDAAKPTIDHAIQNPSAPVPFLGVTSTSVTPLIRQQQNLSVDHGAFVIAVAPKGPAQQAGIKAGDVVVSFDGKSVDTSDALYNLILTHNPGDRASVGVVHTNGKSQTFSVTLGVRPLPTATPSP
ncbi:MAG: S1C family serine protease [Actinomycetota bacterium]